MRWSGALAAALVALAALLGLHTAVRKSPTGDEPKHIATALYRLREGRCCLGRDNGPTLLLNGLPLLYGDDPRSAPIAAGGNPWSEGTRYLLSRDDLDGTVLRARLPSLLLLVGLGAVVFSWSRSLYGSRGGLVSVFLFAFSPTLLAHGSLASPDIHAAFFLVLAAWSWYRFDRSPSAARLVIAGVALGLALSAKHSALVLVPVFAVLAWLGAGTEREGSRWKGGGPRAAFLRTLSVAGAAGVALVVVWLAYGSGFSTVSMNGARFPVPGFPDYLEGLRRVSGLASRGGWSYFLGEARFGGTWYYFPVAAAVKSPIPALLAGACAVALSARIAGPGWRREAHVWLPAAVLFAASLSTRLNIGIRHLLPIYPLLHVFAGRLALLRLGPAWARATVAVILALWYAGGTLRYHPHHLAYFNEVAGGPERGYRIVADSNVDWGQDLKELRRYLDREGIPAVRLSYGGPVSPGRYGIRYQPLPSITPWADDAGFTGPFGERELLVVSAYNLLGIHPSMRGTYAWLRGRRPVARPGYSLFVYDVTNDVEAYRELASLYVRAGMPRLAGVERARMDAARSRGDGG